ncbi:hypothetical protein NPIL_31201 [Nephila pilipes]|uniref:Uncharacterized protein n=1 Tax=Nephila pilipes TaxID=299642 RepID=A0A8X6I367_NEPPI|nr:hypothetical protein NPIL_31201 [Nephila pilipes]
MDVLRYRSVQHLDGSSGCCVWFLCRWMLLTDLMCSFGSVMLGISCLVDTLVGITAIIPVVPRLAGTLKHRYFSTTTWLFWMDIVYKISCSDRSLPYVDHDAPAA